MAINSAQYIVQQKVDFMTGLSSWFLLEKVMGYPCPVQFTHLIFHIRQSIKLTQ